jgi:hypothetical protein
MRIKEQKSPKVLLQKASARTRRILYLKTKFYTKYASARFRAKTVLTFPHRPHPKSVMYAICHLLGYRTTRNINKEADLIINWEDSTFPRSYETLDQLNERQRVLNIDCKDISKRRLDVVHKAVFGYSLAINPLTYQGLCVKKSNKNATHDGIVIQCPLEEVDEEAVYQIVVNNKANEDYIEDIRVPVFGQNIPFCYRKYRPVQQRFSNENAYVRLCAQDDVLSTTEIELLLQLCRHLGLDYGELDVLRDSDTRKLYVVDVANTPFGPPNHLDSKDVRVALERLSEAFVASYMP